MRARVLVGANVLSGSEGVIPGIHTPSGLWDFSTNETPGNEP